MAQVTIKNVDRLVRKFNNMANIELDKTMGDALKLVHGQAKELAPVDEGYLAESIHMDKTKTPTELVGRVYTNLEYAMYVEFGTGVRGNGSYPYQIEGVNLAYKENWQGMKAQPYMYPALDMHKKTIKKLFKEGTKTKLRKICKGGQ